MLEFGNSIYYIDIDSLDKAITPVGIKPTDKITLTEEKSVYDTEGKLLGSEVTKTSSIRGKEIDGPKYDVLRLMIEILLENEEEVDTTLGSDRALEKTTLAYKVAFNTLHKYGILKEKPE